MPVVSVLGIPGGEAFIDEPWATVDDMCCDEMAAESPAEAAAALDAASWLLWKLSGEQYGLRTMTIRPCTEKCVSLPPVGTGWTQGGEAATWGTGYFTRFGCKSCPTGRCPCRHVDRVKVPRPTREVHSVWVDGAVLDPAAYRIDTRRRSWLYRIDGGRWPTCQDWAAGPGDDGYFAISLLRGKQIPSFGVTAAAELACELLKACRDDDECRLPQRVTSYTRNGVTVPVIDVMEFIEKRRTGLYTVDMFLGAANPSGLARRARAFSAEDL